MGPYNFLNTIGGGEGERGPRGFPGVSIINITTIDNQNGSINLTFTLSDGTEYNFVNTLVSDILIDLNKLELSGPALDEKLNVKDSFGGLLFNIDTLNGAIRIGKNTGTEITIYGSVDFKTDAIRSSGTFLVDGDNDVNKTTIKNFLLETIFNVDTVNGRVEVNELINSSGDSTNIRLGLDAGNGGVVPENVSIGNNSGEAYASVNIGTNANSSGTNNSSVAIGFSAGGTNQGDTSTAIGFLAAQNGQSNGAVAIGASAGNSNQGLNSVAIGTASALSNQGDDCIAIGYLAGQNNQSNKSIAINASGATLDTTTSGLFVKPVVSQTEQVGGNPILTYNDDTGQIGKSTIVIENGALQTTSTFVESAKVADTIFIKYGTDDGSYRGNNNEVIERAFNSLVGGGGIILGQGTYSMENLNPFLIPTGKWFIRGSPNGGTVIQMNTNVLSGTQILFDVDTNTSMHFSDITFEASTPNVTNIFFRFGTNITKNDNYYFENCTVTTIVGLARYRFIDDNTQLDIGYPNVYLNNCYFIGDNYTYPGPNLNLTCVALFDRTNRTVFTNCYFYGNRMFNTGGNTSTMQVVSNGGGDNTNLDTAHCEFINCYFQESAFYMYGGISFTNCTLKDTNIRGLTSSMKIKMVSCDVTMDTKDNDFISIPGTNANQNVIYEFDNVYFGPMLANYYIFWIQNGATSAVFTITAKNMRSQITCITSDNLPFARVLNPNCLIEFPDENISFANLPTSNVPFGSVVNTTDKGRVKNISLDPLSANWVLQNQELILPSGELYYETIAPAVPYQITLVNLDQWYHITPLPISYDGTDFLAEDLVVNGRLQFTGNLAQYFNIDVSVSVAGTANTDYQLGIGLNGTNLITGSRHDLDFASSGTFTAFSIHKVVQLSQGDTIEVIARTTSGTNEILDFQNINLILRGSRLL